MFFQRALVGVAAASYLASSASAFDAQSKSNVAVYYGQGYDQPRLREICQDASVDIINIGFINVFPGQGAGGWPGSNFGNQCSGSTYEIGGVKTQLLSDCHQLVEDIPLCQAAGKKVLLSLGGASPDNQRIRSEVEAVLFADFLWSAFGPVNDSWVAMDGPRPFGDVVVDGFDFDIEHNGGFGYATMIDRFRGHFNLIPDRAFYISGAPQCSIPDQQLSLAIATSVFDFVWVQFYNTAGCSARDFFNADGSGNGGFNYDAWVRVIENGGNPAAKLYIGLPASESAANTGYYLTPEEVDILVAQYMGRYPDNFGGIMLWEATAAERNMINGTDYAEHIKNILVGRDPAHPTPTTVPSSTVPVTSSTPATSGTTSTSVIVSPTTPSIPTTTPSYSRSSSYPSPSATTEVTSILTPSRSPVTSGRPSPSTSPVTSRTRSTPVIRTSTTSTVTSLSSSSVPSRTPTSHHPSSSSMVASSTRVPSSSYISSGRTSSSIGSSSLTSHTSATTSIPSSSSSSGSGQSHTLPSSGVTRTSSNEPGKPTGSSTGTASNHGKSTTTIPPAITDGPQTTGSANPANPNGPSSGDATVTTVIVTSYTSICPTGFTTITTTYTTTYCPGTVPATATVTDPAPGSVAHTTAPSPPEGWTTTVTVCTQCAAIPTTVTLTLPMTATMTKPPSVPESQATAPIPPPPPPPPVGWTTTMTVCTRCGPSPTTLTLTVPISTVTETGPGSGPSVSNGPEGGAGIPSSLDTVPPTTTQSIIVGTGAAHPRPSSSTLFVRPSPSESRVPVAPSATQEHPAPVFTGAAPRQAGLSHAAGVLLALALPMLLMM